MQEFLDIIDGRRVAIVGNGTPDKDESAEIDSADIVVRLNHFYNYDTGLVGKRVDVIVQTFTSAWMNAKNKHADVIKEQCPRIFCGKKPEQYRPDIVAKFLGNVSVSDMSPDLMTYAQFTTGSALLMWLAEKKRNAEFTIHGFPSGEKCDKYFETDAKHYLPLKEEELKKRDAAIQILKQQKIFKKREEKLPVIVIPIRKGSTGVPKKNHKLLPVLLGKLEQANIKNEVWVVGNDFELQNEILPRFPNLNLNIYTTPDGLDEEVTDVLRVWRDQNEYSGEIILLQCTSPRFKVEWLARIMEARRHAPIAATCVRIKFKVNGIFANANGCWSQLVQVFGAPSVPRQRLPEAVRLSGACFAFHSDALSRPSFFLAGTLEPVIVEEEEALDIDTIEDMAKV